MTRIGFVTDVHANLPALRAVLAEFAARDVDRVVCGGDVVGIGPEPDACVRELAALPGVVAVLGNHDEYAVHGVGDDPLSWMDAAELAHHRWVRTQLSGTAYAALGGRPRNARFEVDGVRVLAVHYGLEPDGWTLRPFVTPRGTRPEPAQLDGLFDTLPTADVVLYGHSHDTNVARGTAWYVDPGSAGCFDRPEARFAVIDCHRGAARVGTGTVPYDGGAVIRAYDDNEVASGPVVRSIFLPWSLDPAGPRHGPAGRQGIGGRRQGPAGGRR